MFHIEDVLQVKDGEAVKLLIRRHAITLMPALSLALLLIVIPFFLLFQLFAIGFFGVLIFMFLVISGVILVIRGLLLWDSDVMVVTTMRLVDVDQKGIFSRFVSEIPLNSIADATWKRQGVVDTMFNVGSITIKSSGQTEPLVIKRISQPARIHEYINDLRHATSPQRDDLSQEKQEKLRKLAGLLEELPAQALDKIESAIKHEGRADAMAEFLQKDSDQQAS